MSKTRLDYYQHGACKEKWIQRFDDSFSVTYHGYKDGDKKIIDKVLVMASDNVKTDSDGTYSRFNSDTCNWVNKFMKPGEWSVYHYDGTHFNVVNKVDTSNLYIDTSYNISIEEFVQKYADSDYPVVYEEPLKIDAEHLANWLREKDCYIGFMHNMYKEGYSRNLSELIDVDVEHAITLAFGWSDTPEHHEFWDDIDYQWREHLKKPKKKKVVKAATKKNPETDIFEF